MSGQKKLSKKELLKIKKAEKAAYEKERDNLIDKYYNEHLIVLDKYYMEVLSNIEEINKEVDDECDFMELQLAQLYVLAQIENFEKIEETLNILSDRSQEFCKKICKRSLPGKIDTIVSPLLDAGKELNSYLNSLSIKLMAMKVKNYDFIVNKINYKIQEQSKKYTDIITEDFYFNNDKNKRYAAVMKEYSEFCQKYAEYLELEEEDLEQVTEFESNTEEISIPRLKSRLRCTHADMKNFAKHMGYEEIRQTNSTHKIYRHRETGISMPIPEKGGKTLPQGTMSRILKQMGLKRSDLAVYLSNN